MKKIKIGIPRTNNYYKYGVFWKHFFLSLNCKIVLSPETTINILNNGENNLQKENCLQNRIYFGHIKELSNSCDYILISKTCDYYSNCYNYKFFLESIKTHLISSQILLFDFSRINIIEIIKIALKITKNPIRIIYSYIKSIKKQIKHNKNVENFQKHELTNNQNKILIVGNYNILEDKYTSNSIINFISKNNITPLFSNKLNEKEAQFFSKHCKERFYNKEIRNILGATYYYKYSVKYIIYLTTSNCILDNYLYNYIKKETKKITTLNVEENKQQLETKIELLIDMIKSSKN